MTEWFGYAASLTIALSMTMRSIVKFRLISLAGAIMFSFYGYLIGSLPVTILNAFIGCINIYFLFDVFTKKESFEIIEVRGDNRYLLRYLDYYKKEIQKYFPGFTYKPEVNTVSFLILRNMVVAGVFLAHREDDNVLSVGLDFVSPEYRDFKNARFVYYTLRHRFVEAGYTRVTTRKHSPKHESYLLKLGFQENNQGLMEKTLP